MTQPAPPLPNPPPPPSDSGIVIFSSGAWNYIKAFFSWQGTATQLSYSLISNFQDAGVSIQSELSALTTAIESLLASSAGIAGTEKRLEEIEGELASVQSSLASINSDVAAIKRQMQSLSDFITQPTHGQVSVETKGEPSGD